MFSRLRGSRNLIFAESRRHVEWYADTLREISEKAKLTSGILSSSRQLSREHRTDLEVRLKTHSATTAICTSTLELGIDIGDVACVAQIGAPFTVASLRQRLGRSGRRAGQPAVLRMYAIVTEPSADSHPLDRLRLDFVRSVAMAELLLEGWCEPPAPQALHLSTLTHQILSVIAEHGGVKAKRLYVTLCERGPFRRVDPSLFARFLRHLGGPEVALIEQASDGTLLLGRQGERLVKHHSFYAVFQTPVEYRIIVEGKLLGTLPVTQMLAPDMRIIFSGRRWCITAIHDKNKVIEVVADWAGSPPSFGGEFGLIHDRVVEKMKEILSGNGFPTYLDKDAKRLLNNARSEFRWLGFDRWSTFKIDKCNCLIATWTGSAKTSTLALALQAMGYTVETHDGFLHVTRKKGVQPVEAALQEITSSSPNSAHRLLSGKENLTTEKFHPYLSTDLLLEEAASSRINLAALPELAQNIIKDSSIVCTSNDQVVGG